MADIVARHLVEKLARTGFEGDEPTGECRFINARSWRSPSPSAEDRLVALTARS